MTKFKERAKLDLSQVNQEVLNKWNAEDVFHKSISEREGYPEFIFFEGPPSANGHPGIHHVMGRTIKDTFLRYKTMQGFQVKRKAGWDTHGLPVELSVEKSLGITKEDIGKKISVDDYNRACRENVMMYTNEWTELTDKMGYWVDLEHPYITYDNKYIETLWYLLKRLYDKGLLYKGYTIQPYSPAAGTGSFGLRLVTWIVGNNFDSLICCVIDCIFCAARSTVEISNNTVTVINHPFISLLKNAFVIMIANRHD